MTQPRQQTGKSAQSPKGKATEKLGTLISDQKGFAGLREVGSCLFLVLAIGRAVGNSTQNVPKEWLYLRESHGRKQWDPTFRVLESPIYSSSATVLLPTNYYNRQPS